MIERKVEHTLFVFSIWVKGLAGAVETIGGILVLFVTQKILDSFVLLLVAPELAEDPADQFANFIVRSAQTFSTDTRGFASAYLIVHGLIKILLVAALLREKLWAYPVSLWFLGVFIFYQCYRYTHTHSIWLVLLTVLDALVMFLIWREYQWHKRNFSNDLDKRTTNT